MRCIDLKKLLLAHESAGKRAERYSSPDAEPKLIVTKADPLEPKLEGAKSDVIALSAEIDQHLRDCSKCVPLDQRALLLYIGSVADSEGKLSEEASNSVYAKATGNKSEIAYLYRGGFLRGKIFGDSLLSIYGLTTFGRRAVSALKESIASPHQGAPSALDGAS